MYNNRHIAYVMRDCCKSIKIMNSLGGYIHVLKLLKCKDNIYHGMLREAIRINIKVTSVAGNRGTLNPL